MSDFGDVHDEWEPQSQGAWDRLRKPVPAPDLTASILSEVGSRRPWLRRRTRRLVAAGRLGIAACFLVALGALYAAQRTSPETFQLTPVSAPLSQLVDTSRTQAQENVQKLTAAFGSVRNTTAVRPEAQGMLKRLCASMPCRMHLLQSASFVNISGGPGGSSMRVMSVRFEGRRQLSRSSGAEVIHMRRAPGRVIVFGSRDGRTIQAWLEREDAEQNQTPSPILIARDE